MKAEIHHGDCLEVMRAMEPACFTAIVTDPPYGLGFMGKEWDAPGAFVERASRRRAGSFESVQGNHNPEDSQDRQRTRLVEGRRFHAWSEAWAREALRVLKPGGLLLAFGGTRTFHRLACAIEDAGFEVRDCLSWLYGSGFPKSLDISKAIDKAAGAPVGGMRSEGFGVTPGTSTHTCRACGRSRGSQAGNCRCDYRHAPATDLARAWSGYGTALKPAWESIVLAMKPLDGTFAGNAEKHGVAGLNVDGGRIGTDAGWSYPNGRGGEGWHGRESLSKNLDEPIAATAGRFPANVLLDEEAAAMLDEQSGELASGTRAAGEYGMMGFRGNGVQPMPAITGDSGGASRFFYTAKAASAERHAEGEVRNTHPTVKPLDLMQYLVRLVKMPSGTRVLDPFAGSGSTLVAALREGVEVVGIEREAEYVEIAARRIKADAPLYNEVVVHPLAP